MLSNISELASLEPHDVVIVGGGAAGLTLAHALKGKGLKILLLEAGGEKRKNSIQDFYRGEFNDPHPRIDRYRERAIGGTSRIWGGRLIPFDPIDFERRPWVPHSGWPISYDSLKPYYERATREADGGVGAYDVLSALPNSQKEFVPGVDSDLVATTLERFSKPTNFWKRYGESLREADDVRVVLAAPVTGVRLVDGGSAVHSLTVSSADGKNFCVKGRYYVLCLGGLETARLLLASHDQRSEGIGNSSGELGRYYMSHLSATAGTISFNRQEAEVAHDYERDAEGIYVRRRLWLNENAQRRFHLLNTTFRTELPDLSNPDHGNPVLSAMFLVKSILLYEYTRRFSERKVSLAVRGKHVKNILGHPLQLTRFGINWLRNRTLADRKLPSVVIASPPENRHVWEFHAEQAPNPESRVSLTSERDANGMQRLKVNWRPTPLDFESLRQNYRILSNELVRTGVGKLEYDPDSLEPRAYRYGIVGGHHIGTTRMSEDPRHGVVDSDCRLHDVPNLYIASSSVFPTSGQANPTLTLLALTLRLADRLLLNLR